ncbi:venom carboxylesterase-6-like [Ostrinia furnacalis]|uniref:venom carboxylesterase-6-like n=1 Tax=Ostrinia furnacalis TaxID=93504 RepID=UPI00103E8C3F|nr:venom carboxylesterase-6-like [Ostrinia furnacalis]
MPKLHCQPREKYLKNGTLDCSQPRKKCACCYDEDCLYLTIYMPISYNQSRNLPVVVWADHNEVLQYPDFFIEEEVVVVVVTYRRFIFGFLNTGDEFAEGNMGAKDILMALKWIKRYIRSFNGDPNRITVAGFQSAATIVSSLILTPVAEGLFSRIIIIGGSALSPADYRNYNFDVMNKLYWNLNGPFEKLNRTNLYQILANYSTSELMVASEDLFDSTEVRDSQRLINAFCPSIEVTKNTFMSKAPIEVYKARLTNNNVEVMIGYTSLEALVKLKGFIQNKKLLKYLNYNFQYLLPFEGTKDEYGSKRYRKIREKIMEFYFFNGTIGERSLRRYAKYVSDQVIYPLLRQARLQGDASCRNVYLFRFAFRGALNVAWDSSARHLNWSGATSGDEICYLFRCKSVGDVYNSYEASNERLFIKKIARLLANFAKCGDPTPVKEDEVLGNLKWEPLRRRASIRALNMGRRLKMADVPEQPRVNFWDQLKSELFSEKLRNVEL